MPLPEISVPRKLLHRRTVTIEGYQREDGLYDIEGALLDVKGYDFGVAKGIKPAGTPIHLMRMRLTIDRDMLIHDAVAVTDERPYPGVCEHITPHYSALKGLRIMPGFTRKVKELFSGVKGCTHMTEMIGVIATVAFQTRYGSAETETDQKPPHLDGCHALDTKGSPVILQFYPKWYQGPANPEDKNS
jgi:hypothetical protein